MYIIFTVFFENNLQTNFLKNHEHAYLSPDSFHVCTSLAKRVSPLAQNKHLLYTARHREAPKRVVKLPFQKLAP